MKLFAEYFNADTGVYVYGSDADEFSIRIFADTFDDTIFFVVEVDL